jgi:uncharacterized membrane protein (UPF0127 family)
MVPPATGCDHEAVRSSVRFADAAPQWLIDRTRRAAWVVLALGVMAFLIVGANRPANPTLLPPQGIVTEHGLSAFDATGFTVSAGPGLTAAAHPGCALLARTPTQQAKGLMGQSSLHGFAGMVFSFSRPTEQVFSMKGTTMPLSIAWFGSGGNFLGALNMTPCPPPTQICPTYAAGAPYSLALEVARGRLASLGIGPGSILHVMGPCAG